MKEKDELAVFQPSEELSPFVRAFYRLRKRGKSKKAEILTGGPGITVDLWWFRDGSVDVDWGGESKERFSGALIGGSLTKRISVSKGATCEAIGVSLAPGVATALFGLDVRDIRDGFFEQDAVLRGGLREATDRILQSRKAEEGLKALEKELLERLGRSVSVDTRVRLLFEKMAESVEPMGVEAIAKEAGVTRRHLLELSMRAFGVSPSQVVQILRFQNALDRMRARGDVDWMGHRSRKRIRRSAAFHSLVQEIHRVFADRVDAGRAGERERLGERKRRIRGSFKEERAIF